jgi:hypothetical protein
VALAIPETQTLNSGLDADLRCIARGEDHTAVVLALRDLVTTTIATGSLTLFDGVSELLEKADIPGRVLAVQKITDALIGLGPHGGFWRTQQFVPQLVRLIQAVGSTITTEQMVRLVGRGESYSRSGLYGLSRLYDNHWDNARTLDLPAAFRKQGNEDVAWYCDLRECYPEHPSVRLWDNITTLPNLKFGQLMLSNDDGVAMEIHLKWPNRGDSVFLDHLVWMSQPQDD